MSNASPAKPRLLSKINESMVLQAIRDHGPSTRVDLSSRLGVTFPTSAKAVASLLESNLLEEFSDERSGPGRPAKRLRLASKTAQVIGIELDSMTCRVVAAGFDGTLRPATMQSFATPGSYSQLLDAIESRVLPLTKIDDITTLGLGVTTPGVIDYRRQRMVYSANIPYLNNVSLSQDLSDLAGVECTVAHDSHALCLAEQIYGSARQIDNFAMLVHRAGIGLGVMIDGKFLTGHDGFAGEIGHGPIDFTPIDSGERVCSCGRSGCLETLASEWALVQHVSNRFERPMNLGDIILAAEQGDEIVHSALQDTVRYLARSVAGIINIFNPHTIFIHGELFNGVPGLLDDLVDQTSQIALAPAFEACHFKISTSTSLQGSVAIIINYLTSARLPGVELASVNT
jgi:predicted NBD/HSP70 family sugar kinase